MFVLLTGLFLLAACGGGGGSSSAPGVKPQDMHGGKITLNDNAHVVEFDLASGIIKGVVHDADIHPLDVDSVNFNSDRVGWKEDSVATVKFDFDSTGKITIPKTANKDVGTWTLRLKSGEFAWFNIDQWDYAGTTWLKTSNDLIQYGSLVKASIGFVAPGKAVIKWESNVLSGLMNFGVNPIDVVAIRWNSDRVGWNENSTVYGTLQLDGLGDYFTEINGLPNNDKGNFSVVLKSEQVIWFNIDMWSYASNVVVDKAAGQISYIL